ncbi:hypothetical protein [Crossiella cryophila]|uniref:Acyl-coenzyme A thioesterase PaaI-like protein n=1 Tax=Crossiella cryophila TaxID=43355 RepID=A0A7W7G0K5_9PSEU|nr:hypothetical protein [Crossiella cryophila]MBB4682389.1 acyl-coenzyme A thioesterase PaaI-like protein [Crossiella cryophila]
MKKLLCAAVLATGAVLSAAAPALAADAGTTSVRETRMFTATAQNTTPGGAVASAANFAFSQAVSAGFQRSQCYLHSSSTRPSSVIGLWFGTANVFCQR